ncbi:hypothetical protein TNCV_4527461 [Trichonephila clavipes]|nr:hypothetical protein TNCV_4527461 [Trichonephila clavipes]
MYILLRTMANACSMWLGVSLLGKCTENTLKERGCHRQEMTFYRAGWQCKNQTMMPYCRAGGNLHMRQNGSITSLATLVLGNYHWTDRSVTC